VPFSLCVVPPRPFAIPVGISPVLRLCDELAELPNRYRVSRYIEGLSPDFSPEVLKKGAVS